MLASRSLAKRIRSLRPVVVMHDFFIDRIVRLGGQDLDNLFSTISSKKDAGGGSIRGIEQAEVRGGNAVNVAYAAARLGARASLITMADDIGSAILRNGFSPMRNSRLFIAKGRPGYTVSLELPRGGGKSNVMVSDVGDAANFGPERLGRRELAAMRSASAVAVMNWASNLRGTELALKAFRSARKGVLRYLDPADFGSRKEEFVSCLKTLAGKLDVLSINENECRLLMEPLGMEPLPASYSGEDVGDAARSLSDKLSVIVDLHTPIGVASSAGRETVFVQSFDVEVRTTTGAGDVWDAADIIGYLCKMDASDRLLFANACAALYISSADIKAPRLADVTKFISRS